ncbi:serine protease 1-like [Uranotaenia lowii]|uniref:serine protease 1-like n=1 Tax=Uranotaenia lowii TaxID=190385 RepID=UPI002479C7B9|nr:serine protease 1-like [Uranotaenia lowii]
MDARLVITCLLVALSASALGKSATIHKLPLAEDQHFSKEDVPNPFITGGEIVADGEIPYVVGIIMSLPTGTRWCGGTLISTNYVLTAANCFITGPSPATVLLGATNQTEPAEIIPATTLILHPEYEPGFFFNDIALLELSQPATVSPRVRPVRLPNWRQVFLSFQGQLASTSGWGHQWQNSNEILPLYDLRRVRMPVMSNAVCLLQQLGGITDFHICTSTELGSPCQGDQGGPLTVADPDGGSTLIGIFSSLPLFGCNSGWPAIFTRITPYLQWISERTGIVISNDFEY